MNASWKPQVKKPSTSSTGDRLPTASESAWRSDCDAGPPDAPVSAGAVVSASQSCSTSNLPTPTATSVVCQPKASIIDSATGEQRNWPNEPAAAPAPNATKRQLSGNSLP